ncbi:MAG: DUF4255 domain-containing protein [bacterium]
MIRDLDNTLEKLLEQELPSEILADLNITFETPDMNFPPEYISLPAIDLFLYNIQEKQELRSNEWYVERNSNGTAIKKHSPVRVECSYLITAWVSTSPEGEKPPKEEHNLLSEVMKVLLRHPTLPAEVLQGSLKDQELPIRTISLQPDSVEMIGQFWQALGGKVKAVFKYSVIISVDTYKPVKVGVVKKETFEI